MSGVSPLFTFFPPLLVRRSWWVVGVQLSRSNCSSKWLVSLSCGVENVHYVRTQGEEVFKRRLHTAANIYRSSNVDMIYVPGDWKKAFRSPGPQYSCIYTITPGCMLPRRQARWGSQHQVTQRPTVKLNDCSGHSAAYNSRGGRVQIHRKSNHPKLYFYQDQPLFTYLWYTKSKMTINILRSRTSWTQWVNPIFVQSSLKWSKIEICSVVKWKIFSVSSDWGWLGPRPCNNRPNTPLDCNVLL